MPRLLYSCALRSWDGVATEVTPRDLGTPGAPGCQGPRISFATFLPSARAYVRRFYVLDLYPRQPGPRGSVPEDPIDNSLRIFTG